MTRTIRISLAALASAFAIGLATVPASHAAPNDNRFQESGEAKRKKFCADLQASYNFNVSYFKGNPSKRSQWKRTAENLKILAEGNDCSWAQ